MNPGRRQSGGLRRLTDGQPYRPGPYPAPTPAPPAPTARRPDAHGPEHAAPAGTSSANRPSPHAACQLRTTLHGPFNKLNTQPLSHLDHEPRGCCRQVGVVLHGRRVTLVVDLFPGTS
ncbi:hypothetical protein BN2537_125 [Streptomyces venezuelae]|nr:hypothetical protein BN2537_125 [Streptomyces venezuelae]